MDRLLREEFEKEFEPRGYDMRAVPDGHNFGHYIDDMTEGAWRGWQAEKQRYKHLDDDTTNPNYQRKKNAELKAFVDSIPTQNCEHSELLTHFGGGFTCKECMKWFDKQPPKTTGEKKCQE